MVGGCEDFATPAPSHHFISSYPPLVKYPRHLLTVGVAWCLKRGRRSDGSGAAQVASGSPSARVNSGRKKRPPRTDPRRVSSFELCHYAVALAVLI
jgi:hypothetical protein